MVRVVLVDDHRILQQGLKRLIETTGTVSVVACADTAQAGLDAVKEHSPDVGVFDLGLPDHSGFWLISRVRRIAPEMPILVLSMHTESELVGSVLRAGANGYLCKSTDSEVLLGAIDCICSGDTFLEDHVREKLEEDGWSQEVCKRTLGNDFETVLDPKEIEVLSLIANGFANNQIGERLGVSLSTVKARLRSIFGKLGVDTRAQAVAAAISIGLLPPA